MVHILHIDASPRGERSVSRTLAGEFVDKWKAAHPGGTVTYRDLGHNPVPLVDETWIAAAFTPPEARPPELAQAIAISDELVDELLAADRYIFSVPMYNFNVPAGFKAYIDQIVRVGRTFAVTQEGYAGLVAGKKALFITAQGGSYRPGTPAEAYNFQEPYLRAIFGFLGITDVSFIQADTLNRDEPSREKSLAEAQSAVRLTASSW
ncbi:FMN-dependent NADH-azoreductase [Gloeobacter kilaueensis]|uniref:FMN dependent NADH:quinone oxidoreductase n=1 Tax=Gloeobacter kilaueensis (strain ATCC BAA-2537 / CCAP 1431/1 / ULC 316 / JS1) TaxID=1183438 RepID=U5QK55_GLOK1|nr:FMN-dependent NADH-azoreductase [Gloeobacter kilaueensis]AGY59332.1 NAD(P)H dehydrogenase (quinone) [Gloeobacter kilaueensis JS1]